MSLKSLLVALHTSSWYGLNLSTTHIYKCTCMCNVHAYTYTCTCTCKNHGGTRQALDIGCFGPVSSHLASVPGSLSSLMYNCTIHFLHSHVHVYTCTCTCTRNIQCCSKIIVHVHVHVHVYVVVNSLSHLL